MKVSRYITYLEATTSQTATRKRIDNSPNEEQLECMKLVGTEVFDRVRENFAQPLRVSSFFRSEKLNKAVGGAKTSQHTKGQAIDIQSTGRVTNKVLFDYIKNYLDFDQLIWEFGNKDNPAWVHVSYVSKEKNRKQIIYIK